jgi:hypothetical protein
VSLLVNVWVNHRPRCALLGNAALRPLQVRREGAREGERERGRQRDRETEGRGWGQICSAALCSVCVCLVCLVCVRILSVQVSVFSVDKNYILYTNTGISSPSTVHPPLSNPPLSTLGVKGSSSRAAAGNTKWDSWPDNRTCY